MVVESASDGVSGVDADPEGILLLEPQGEGAEESTGDSLPTALFRGVDPLEFGVAVVAAGQMTGDESYQLFFVFFGRLRRRLCGVREHAGESVLP